MIKAPEYLWLSNTPNDIWENIDVPAAFKKIGVVLKARAALVYIITYLSYFLTKSMYGNNIVSVR